MKGSFQSFRRVPRSRTNHSSLYITKNVLENVQVSVPVLFDKALSTNTALI